LENTDKNKNEMAKDVSAMANAAGGLIVYGIVEAKSGVADRIDDGSTATPEWIDQILTTNIEPKIVGVTIKRIQLPSGKAAYAIEVPMATTFAPHQSKPQKIYFRRHNTTVLAMLDHEVRDLMRRGEVPELYLTYSISPEAKDWFKLIINIGNHSAIPALYTNVDLIFEESLAPQIHSSRFSEHLMRLSAMSDSKAVKSFRTNYTIPNDMPIFAGLDAELVVSYVAVAPNTWGQLAYQVSCPGFNKRQWGRLMRQGTPPPTIKWVTDRFSLRAVNA
jgi:hypothetical protein